MPSPDEVAPVVAYLMSGAAKEIIGCTVLVRGLEVGLVSNPEFQWTETREGGWKAEQLADEFRYTVAEGVDLTKDERTF